MQKARRDAPVLSVLIISWNTRDLLKRCLTSVKETKGGLATEIVVVDNASSDGSADTVMSEFRDVRLIRNQRNEGFVHGNNQALAIAKGEYVLFLNPDAELLPDALRMMTAYLTNHPDVGIVGPQLLYPDGRLQNSHFGFPDARLILIEHFVSARVLRWMETPHRKHQKERRVDVIRGACLMCRKRVLDQTGGMNHHLFMYSEETDLCFKTKKMGLDVVFLPTALVIHHERQSMKIQMSSFALFHYFRSKVIFLRDNYDAARARRLVRLIALSLTLKRALYTIVGLKGRGKSFRELHLALRNEFAW